MDSSYQVSVHLAEGFQRRRFKCEKLADDRRRTSSDGKSSHCLWQGELIKQGISRQPDARQIASLIAFFPGYFVFKNENVKVKVKFKPVKWERA